MRTAQAGLVPALAHYLHPFTDQCPTGANPIRGVSPALALLLTGASELSELLRTW
jgi:hypothetical protein